MRVLRGFSEGGDGRRRAPTGADQMGLTDRSTSFGKPQADEILNSIKRSDKGERGTRSNK